MSWFRVIFGIAGAVLVTLFIVSSTLQDNARDGCVSSSTRANANANNWMTAAKIRASQGDHAVASEYRENVNEVRLSIPVPDGWNGKLVDRGQNKTDRLQGCEDAYPPVLPFIG